MKDKTQKCNCGVGGLVKPIRKLRSGVLSVFNLTRLETDGEMDTPANDSLALVGCRDLAKHMGMLVGNSGGAMNREQYR